MNALIYPIHLRRDFERRRAARMADDPTRQSPPSGTDTCVCGATVTAPSSSTYAPDRITNHWECSVCSRRWKTNPRSYPMDKGRPKTER
jgi:hypothetical protein